MDRKESYFISSIFNRSKLTFEYYSEAISLIMGLLVVKHCRNIQYGWPFLMLSLPTLVMSQSHTLPTNCTLACPNSRLVACLPKAGPMFINLGVSDKEVCHTVRDCNGGNSGSPLPVQQKPVNILSDQLLSMKVDQIVASSKSEYWQFYKVSSDQFTTCTSFTTSGTLVANISQASTFIFNSSQYRTGKHYFAGKVNNILTCNLGLRIIITIKSQHCSVGDNSLICNGKGTCTAGQNDSIATCSCCNGYNGTGCGEFDACLSKPCFNQGNCTDITGGLNTNHTCTCTPYYTGKNCETKIDFCKPMPCLNNATCENLVLQKNYSCNCEPGFTGRNCEINIDDCIENNCTHNATCVDLDNGYRCECGGNWTGRFCSQDINECRTIKCQNNGTCINEPGTFSCSCPVNVTGRLCEKDLFDNCVSSPCLNGGVCKDLVGSFNCTCPQGYEGKRCQNDIDECLSNPCSPQGTSSCINGLGNYSCLCLSQYTGQRCEKLIDNCVSKPCLNGGLCVNMYGGYSCVCPAGYHGLNCQDVLNKCSYGPCRNNGTCDRTGDFLSNYTCNCTSGWTGRNCTEDFDECLSNPCLNNATCHNLFNRYRCACRIGWNGNRCERNVNACESMPCVNNATCSDLQTGLDYTCACTVGFTGKNCSVNINDCTRLNANCNNGRCIDQIGSYYCNCSKGWYGKYCDTNRDICSSMPCLNEASCENVNSTSGFVCQCKSGWTGANCGININDCASNPCQNRATCNDFVNFYNCTCRDGYAGRYCEREINECLSNPCVNNATCVNNIGNYSCICLQGFGGVRCETNVNECSSVPCFNNATCIDDINRYSCRCKGGYEGIHCEIPICRTNPCMYGGVCMQGQDGYTCQCKPGYTGKNCEQEINECTSNPCRNNASCIDAVNGYRCNCVNGYTGKTCETHLCDVQVCKNGAGCQRMPSGYFCNCSNGFTGRNCDQEIDECSSNPCNVTGSVNCTNAIGRYRCNCKGGYVGQICNSHTCDAQKPCLNGAECLRLPEGYQCVCLPGFNGTDCQQNINECASNPCINGTCIDQVNGYSCECFSMYTGARCETNMDLCASRPCMNNATCTNNITSMSFSCSCLGGYTGNVCQNHICDSLRPCRNNATCVQLPNTYACKCTQGFAGNQCETEINECTSSPCSNGGVCVDQIGSFVCSCPRNFTGNRCETFLDYCTPNPCNNGTCINNYTVNTYNCICPKAFSGRRCKTHICDVKNPCQNGAICIRDLDRARCNCLEGYSGENCSKNIDECASNPCLNNGTCVDLIGGFTCQCPSQYTGKRCEAVADYCAGASCSNSSTCINDFVNKTYKCLCHPFTTGRNCEVYLGPCHLNPCYNNGTCVETAGQAFNCACPFGYSGSRCEAVTCPCQNNGRCALFNGNVKCICPNEYGGALCQDFYGDCRNNASRKCVDDSFCIRGVHGYYCKCTGHLSGNIRCTALTTCNPSPCLHNATCKNNGFLSLDCICRTGYAGPFCQFDVDECASSPCLNGGTCREVNAGNFTCYCPSKYFGNRCQYEANLTSTYTSTAYQSSLAFSKTSISLHATPSHTSMIISTHTSESSVSTFSKNLQTSSFTHSFAGSSQIFTTSNPVSGHTTISTEAFSSDFSRTGFSSKISTAIQTPLTKVMSSQGASLFSHTTSSSTQLLSSIQTISIFSTFRQSSKNSVTGTSVTTGSFHSLSPVLHSSLSRPNMIQTSSNIQPSSITQFTTTSQSSTTKPYNTTQTSAMTQSATNIRSSAVIPSSTISQPSTTKPYNATQTSAMTQSATNIRSSAVIPSSAISQPSTTKPYNTTQTSAMTKSATNIRSSAVIPSSTISQPSTTKPYNTTQTSAMTQSATNIRSSAVIPSSTIIQTSIAKPYHTTQTSAMTKSATNIRSSAVIPSSTISQPSTTKPYNTTQTSAMTQSATNIRSSAVIPSSTISQPSIAFRTSANINSSIVHSSASLSFVIPSSGFLSSTLLSPTTRTSTISGLTQSLSLHSPAALSTNIVTSAPSHSSTGLPSNISYSSHISAKLPLTSSIIRSYTIFHQSSVRQTASSHLPISHSSVAYSSALKSYRDVSSSFNFSAIKSFITKSSLAASSDSVLTQPSSTRFPIITSSTLSSSPPNTSTTATHALTLSITSSATYLSSTESSLIKSSLRRSSNLLPSMSRFTLRSSFAINFSSERVSFFHSPTTLIPAQNSSTIKTFSISSFVPVFSTTQPAASHTVKSQMLSALSIPHPSSSLPSLSLPSSSTSSLQSSSPLSAVSFQSLSLSPASSFYRSPPSSVPPQLSSILLPDPCSPNPCLQKGNCTQTSPQTYNCSCEIGYGGKTCNQLLCQCQNKGRCLRDNPSSSYRCACQVGYTGTFCEIKVGDCRTHNCSGNGICRERLQGFVCRCNQGYYGDRCEKYSNTCSPNPCHNSGICVTRSNATGGGFTCLCQHGYQGQLCQFDFDECASSPCLNGGTCREDSINSYQCYCPTWSYGTDCELLRSSALQTQASSAAASKIQATPSASSRTSHAASSIVQGRSTVVLPNITSSMLRTFTAKYTSHLSPQETYRQTINSELPSLTETFTEKASLVSFMTSLQPTPHSTRIKTTSGGLRSASSIVSSSDQPKTVVSSIHLLSIPANSTIYATPLRSATTDSIFTRPRNSSTAAFPTSILSDRPVSSTTQPTILQSTVTDGTSTYPPSPTKSSNPVLMSSSSPVPTSTPFRNLTCADRPCNGYPCYDQRNNGLQFRCVCHYPSFGPRCIQGITVHFPYFNGHSYVEYTTIPFTNIINTVTLTFRTTFSHGLLLYAGHQTYRDFILIRIVSGQAEFRFNAGADTVSIRTKARVDTGRLVTLVATHDSRFGTGTLALNSSAPISRSSSSTSFTSIQLSTSWFLGGFNDSFNPVNASRGLPTLSNLVGCIRDIQVNTMPYRVLNAKNWLSISECDVAACQRGPCRNNATCIQNKENSQQYTCQCGTGYYGKDCTEREAHCQGDPCNGGTCAWTPTGHICLCQYGRHGAACLSAINITRPTFSHVFNYSSYIEYPWQQTVRNADVRFDVKMQFKFDLRNQKSSQNGLLAYTAQSTLGTAGDDFFALGIINNYTYLLYDLGGGLASVRSLLKIDHTRTWHSIVAGRSGRSGYVYLDDQTPVHVTSPGVLTGLDVYSPLYIGGVHDFSKLPPIVRAYFNTGFVGTIFEAGFRTSSTDFTPLLTVPIGAVPSGVTGVPVERGLNIGDSAVNECVPNPCKNNGICSQNAGQFQCKCTTGWAGITCQNSQIPCIDFNPCAFGSTCQSNSNGISCDCQLGRMGVYCDQAVNITQPFFKANSFMGFKRPNVKYFTKIYIRFKAAKLNGLLFYLAEKIDNSKGDFFAISLWNGYVYVRFNLGLGVSIMRSRNKITLKRWHGLYVERRHKEAIMRLDSFMFIGVRSSGSYTQLNVGSIIYLGGLPRLSALNPAAVKDVNSQRDFEGTVSSFVVNNVPQNFNSVQGVIGRNIEDRNRTCVLNDCANGAKCSLRSILSNEPYVCSCSLGWQGRFCDAAIPTYSRARFSGDGFIHFNNTVTTPKSENHIEFMFNTSKEGLLLWLGDLKTNTSEYLAFGIKNGRLTLSLNLGGGKFQVQVSEIVSNGIPHKATVSRIQASVFLTVNGFLPVFKNIISTDYLLDYSGHVYIGGLDGNITSLSKDQYATGLDGCIWDIKIGLNAEYLNLNKNPFNRGKNVQSCG